MRCRWSKPYAIPCRCWRPVRLLAPGSLPRSVPTSIRSSPGRYYPYPFMTHPRPTWSWRLLAMVPPWIDRKSTRLNSSHVSNSYAVFCLKKKRSTSEDSNQEVTRTTREGIPHQAPVGALEGRRVTGEADDVRPASVDVAQRACITPMGER